MAIQNNYRILVGLVIILFATNLSMGLSFIYHRQQNQNIEENQTEEKLEVPAQQRTRFFKEQLNLDPSQVEIFRDLNRKFNRTAWQITYKLQDLRIELVNELGNDPPDMKNLNAVSLEIGNQHSHLKNETIDYYMAMREVCNAEQKEKLNELFMSVLENNEDLKLPQRGRRFRNVTE
jgi:Spy/CpxP family protein refolding chaperone